MEFDRNKSTLLVGGAALLLLGSILFSQPASAHGYVAQPPSRAFACQRGLNRDCGGAQYEPQSVGEGIKGFPAAGPVDGRIPSAGNNSFAAMDVQSASRWHLTPISGPSIDFDWYYYAAHLTTGWEYFVTKVGWNPNQPLSRDSFELTPFCTVDGGGGVPIDGPEGGQGSAKDIHRCTLPADRSGHHVILSAWTVANTAMAFYKVMDVDIQRDGGPGEPPDGWAAVGNIVPARTLLVGDKVTARAFIGSDESEPHSTQIGIDTPDEGAAQEWAFKLATAVNANQTLVRAGVRDEEGAIRPVRGNNQLFVQAESGITSFQLGYELPPSDAYLHLHDLQAHYPIAQGRAAVDFSVMSNRTLDVQATLFDAAKRQVGFSRGDVDGAMLPISIAANSRPGAHELVVIGTSEDGRVVLQQERPVLLLGDDHGGDYEHVYPEGIGSYSGGTRVLHTGKNEIYECKAFPASGWCRIYSPTANQYEPGVGSNWQDAWIAR